ncbi:MAG: hypothetical protein ACYT04_000000100660, partial [Nostoc sp.]
ANSYDWANRLAFMYILEDFQFKFYSSLLRFVPEDVGLELMAIASDEENHAIQLSALLWNIAGVKREMRHRGYSPWSLSRQHELVFWWQVRL